MDPIKLNRKLCFIEYDAVLTCTFLSIFNNDGSSNQRQKKGGDTYMLKFTTREATNKALVLV